MVIRAKGKARSTISFVKQTSLECTITVWTVNIEKRLTLLRNGLAEFPGNKKLLYELAATLSSAGWVRVGEHIRYNDECYLVHAADLSSANEYWQKTMKILETLFPNRKTTSC